ncbi:hypothetical protein [Stenotrophomonas maltophilia]|uniref:hypothetical protein n=1 Tax=Stenotrophomonas maltophilia TaxID=40324 RepID=UPI0013FDBB17|nr:hypothetical protein [Stenotrophomonas maltophilia]
MKLLSAVIALLLSNAALAQDCGNASAVYKASLQRIASPNSVTALRKAGSISLISVMKAPSDGGPAPWELLEASGDQMCVVAKGTDAVLLSDARNTHGSNRYGMPGSGHPRCATGMIESSGLPASADVRFWANRELGDSLVFGLGDGNNVSYTVLTSTDNTGPWIVLKQTGDETCYYDRGDASVIELNAVAP